MDDQKLDRALDTGPARVFGSLGLRGVAFPWPEQRRALLSREGAVQQQTVMSKDDEAEEPENLPPFIAMLERREGNVYVLRELIEDGVSERQGKVEYRGKIWRWDIGVRWQDADAREFEELFEGALRRSGDHAWGFSSEWWGDEHDLNLLQWIESGGLLTAATDELYRELATRLDDIRANGFRAIGKRFQVDPDFKKRISVLTPGSIPGSVLPVQVQRKTARHPNLFQPNSLTILSDPLSQAAIRGMWAPDEWTKLPNLFPFFTDKNGVQVYLGPHGSDVAPTRAAITQAQQMLLDMDDSKVSTFIICMGKWLADTGGDRREQTRVHVEDVLGFRGVKKHPHGGYRLEQKQETAADVLFLNGIWVRTNEEVWEEDARGKRRRVPVHVNSRLFEVAVESHPNMFGGETPYAFRIRPGDWAPHYLGGANHWTARVLKPIMLYHPYTERPEMRLGIYLTFQWRMRFETQNFKQPWRMHTLLEGARIAVPERNRDRFRESVEAALKHLVKDGVLQSARCLDDLPAGNSPPRTWLRPWLDARWRLSPPQEVLEVYTRETTPGKLHN